METTNLNLKSAPSGYSQYDEYFAQMTTQGNRRHYMIVLPLSAVPVVLPVPDPNEPLEDNRVIRPGHAKGFADYVRRNRDWHSGPLTVRTTSDTVQFEVIPGGDFGTLKIGIAKVPRNSRSAFRIVDGQHRVLGIDVMIKSIEEELREQQAQLARAVEQNLPASGRRHTQEKINLLKEQRDRAAKDSIGVDLLVEDTPEKARQIFVDVANNAIGISKSVTTRFDSRKVVNRALSIVLTNPTAPQLIVDRIDQEKDRVIGSNPNLLGATHLADIIRTIEVGSSGRVSELQESTLDEHELAQHTFEFFEVLQDSFKGLREIAFNQKSPGELRDSSLLLSTTMLRVLAGVYHNLTVDHTGDEIVKFFEKLDGLMDAPVRSGEPAGDLWLTSTKSEVFSVGATAPGARSQQVKELTSVITGWATNPPALLEKK